MSDELAKTWSPIGHLHSVAETEELRKAYNDTIPLLTEYHTEFAQNEDLYKALAQITESADYAHLTPAQQRTLANEIRDFKLAGVNLPTDKKAEIATLQLQASQLNTKFGENLLDATGAWYLQITKEEKEESNE